MQAPEYLQAKFVDHTLPDKESMKLLQNCRDV